MNCCKCAIKLSGDYVVLSDETYCNKCHKKMGLNEQIENLTIMIYNMIDDIFGDLYPTSYYNDAMREIRDALYGIVASNDV
jgi:hypothetical protein